MYQGGTLICHVGGFFPLHELILRGFFSVCVCVFTGHFHPQPLLISYPDRYVDEATQ